MPTDSDTVALAPPRPTRAARPARAEHLPKKPALSVVVIDNPAELTPYLAGWDALAASALEPNVFYESWMLRPALEAYGKREDVRVVLVVADLPPESSHAPLVCGLFPLERRRRYKGLPVSALSLWRYVHCYLGTPLLHAAYARETLAAFLDFLASDHRASPLMEWTWVPGEGPFHRLLIELLAERRCPSLIEDTYSRALLAPRASARAYLEEVLSGERRRRLRKHEERLREQGTLEYAVLEQDGDVTTWLEDFLRLEAGGWKGREGTALQCSAVDRGFFLAIMGEAFRRGQLTMMALRLNGRPIAMLSDLLGGPGSFLFKLSFDETFAAFSPGALLEMEKIRRFHDQEEVRWSDSCNAPGPALLKDLWADRRVIETILTAPGKGPGPFVVATLPLLRWLRHKAGGLVRLFRRRPASQTGGTT